MICLLLAIVIAGCTANPVTQEEPLPSSDESTATVDPVTPAFDTEGETEMETTTPAATSSPPPTKVQLPTPAAAATPEPPVDAALTNSEDEVLLVYKRSGGYAGLNEEFTVSGSGRISAKDGREWQVDAHQVDQLLQEIEALGFYDLAPQYKTKDPCCDHITFELTVNSGDRLHTVSGVSGAPGAPDQLWTISNHVQQFFTQVLRREN
ncbi:MAG: hypothetical protein R3293_18235 [Candidatus Promineifilaceae bacterium]|nr:hypothetical protein [Candidatus Promineifilaceae bacterium]